MKQGPPQSPALEIIKDNQYEQPCLRDVTRYIVYHKYNWTFKNLKNNLILSEMHIDKSNMLGYGGKKG